MSILHRKLRRDLWRSKGLILAITSLMALGVMCFIYMRSAYNNLDLAKDDYYARCRMADFWVDCKKVPLAELPGVASIPGISEIQPRIQFYATVDLPRVATPLNGLVLSLPDRRQTRLNDIVLMRGSYFTERRRNEVLVNDKFAQQHGLYPGQTIHLILNNRREELFIVGTAISSEFVYLVGPGALVPDPEHFGVFYLKQTYAEEVFDFEGAANQIVGLLAPEQRERPERILREIEQRLASYGVFATIARRDQSSHQFLTSEIKGIDVFSTFLPGIFLSVAAMVLNVLMTRLIEQQRTIVGTLKALGYSSAQIFTHYMTFGAVVGVVAGLMGCVMGYGMAEFVTWVYRQIYQFPNLANQIYPSLYLTGPAISLACALVGSLYGARSALRLQPAEAMRAKPPAQGGRIWLERLSWLWNRLSFAWRMIMRNIFRHRLRTGVGVFAAAMGAGIVATGLVLHAGTSHLIDFQFNKVLLSDVDLTFKDERGVDAHHEIRRLPGVERAEPVLNVACEFFHGSHRRKGAIQGLAADAELTVPRDVQGAAVRLPKVGVTMTRKMAEHLQVKPGDIIMMEPVKGLKRKRPMPVIEIVDSYLGLAVYADIDYLSSLIGEEFALTGAQLKLADGGVGSAALLKELKQLPALEAFAARKTMVDSLEGTVVKVQRVFIGILIIFAGIIFFSSLLNTSLISLAERQREVATLRVQGFDPWQIGGYFFRENLLITVAGTILGMPVGYLLGWAMAVIYNTDTIRFPLVTPPWVFFMTGLLGLLFALLAQLVVQLEISRMDWREALNVKE